MLSLAGLAWVWTHLDSSSNGGFAVTGVLLIGTLVGFAAFGTAGQPES